MRQKEFRGKRTDNNEWAYGWLLTNKLGTYIVTEDNPHECTQYGYLEIEKYHRVKPETVGQHIGVSDDEPENELFDGDIIEMVYQGEKVIGSIEYCGGGYIVASDDFVDGFMWMSELAENDGRYFWIPTAVKIGNVHDNPELFAA